MKSLCLSFALLLALISTAEALDLIQIEGCYQTISIDGKAVQMGADYQKSLTEIKGGVSSVFKNLDGSPLKHTLLVLFTGASGPWYSYHSFVAFPEHGELTQETDRLSYEINQDFYLDHKKVDHYLSLELEQSGKYLTGRAHFESHIRNMSGERTFTLEPTECF